MGIRESSYYDYNRVLSYNGVYNFILGGRGIGKTYGAIKKAIRDGIKRGHEFVYVRRYKDELSTSKATFFEAVKVEFPDYEFRTNGWYAEYAKALPGDFAKRTANEQKQLLKAQEWKVIGYFIALSTAQRMKSVAFPRVRKIIFDEFILEKGLTRYLPQEYAIFSNLYETIDRKRGETIALFLANSVSIDNPYFIHYNIEPDAASHEIVTMNRGFIVCHFPESANYQEDAENTRFGRFLRETDPEYADYVTGNKFKDNHKEMVASKDSKADYLYSLETLKGTFSVWNVLGSPVFYVQEKQPRAATLYTMIPQRVAANRTYLDVSSNLLTYLRTAWRRGDVWFDSPRTRVAFLEIFHR